MKLKKKRKSKRMRGKGTHGWGARKKHQGSGHRGGCGMAGSGKRADQKKTLVIKLYGNKYFGKQGFTSRGTERRLNKVINVGDIEREFESTIKKFGNKEGTLDLSDYKILGGGEIKRKVTIKAFTASESAREKVEKAGGKIILEENRRKEAPKKPAEKKE